jgi:hypothetical protein
MLLGQRTERGDHFDRFEETAKQLCDGDYMDEKATNGKENDSLMKGTRIMRSLA